MDRVRDGRDLMENDEREQWEALTRELLAFGAWAESVLPMVYSIPDHR